MVCYSHIQQKQIWEKQKFNSVTYKISMPQVGIDQYALTVVPILTSEMINDKERNNSS